MFFQTLRHALMAQGWNPELTKNMSSWGGEWGHGPAEHSFTRVAAALILEPFCTYAARQSRKFGGIWVTSEPLTPELQLSLALWSEKRESLAIACAADCVPLNIKPPLCKQSQTTTSVFGGAVGVVCFKFIISTSTTPLVWLKCDWPQKTHSLSSVLVQDALLMSCL